MSLRLCVRARVRVMDTNKTMGCFKKQLFAHRKGAKCQKREYLDILLEGGNETTRKCCSPREPSNQGMYKTFRNLS